MVSSPPPRTENRSTSGSQAPTPRMVRCSSCACSISRSPSSDLGEVGFLPDVLDKYRHMLKAPLGMMLVAGPTGSGKTTTLYASVNQLDRNERNIVTIEDPIEYQFPGINQIQVNQQANITFATGLRSIMRLDPDVILVGEMRDTDTAKMAPQAALTGHLVLSSIHANDAVGALFRLIDLDVEPFSHHIGVGRGRISAPVGAQALPPLPDGAGAVGRMRRLPIWRSSASRSRMSGAAAAATSVRTRATGAGRIFEVLLLDEDIRRLLLKGASTAELRAEALQKGMVTLSPRRHGQGARGNHVASRGHAKHLLDNLGDGSITKYVAYAPRHGEQVAGSVDAVSEEVAERTLWDWQYKVVLLQPVRPRPRLDQLIPSLFGVKPREVITFSRQLATLVESGIALLPAIELLQDQSGGVLARVLGEMTRDIKNGSPFSAAIAQHPEVFPPSTAA